MFLFPGNTIPEIYGVLFSAVWPGNGIVQLYAGSD
jgi:hypothetical protein